MSARQAVVKQGRSVLTGKLSRLGHDCGIVWFLRNPADLRDKARNTLATIAVWGIGGGGVRAWG